jgi:hypothetical protein
MTFLRFTNEDGEHFYVRAESIDAIDHSPADNTNTVLFVAGDSIHCLEQVDDIVEATCANVIEVYLGPTEQAA